MARTRKTKRKSGNEIDPEELLNFDVMFDMDLFPGEEGDENEVFFTFEGEDEAK